ncbi:STM4013/SEN3800 family hydrolase [Chamaesiphon sp. VAR_48_metabat_135_sub]|uniref:STM4013/SEN3800 family hydrolase n=1 Tax=Chamaesiphon sp. VAR_48_metabat_135_sub TaxID=2964699 RepID=UPI00286BEA6A|nr:STM4013/SEN3800 family hydrolase [Chamaesiphon sp. VAR_48_metabat_135_sub]
MNVDRLIGTHDFLFITLDTLRYDVAQECLEIGLTQNLARLLPDAKWERRHTPASFTYAAHQAFFAGFLPTPDLPGKHPRLFALNFAGSETTGANTCVFETADIIAGFADRGYHTICIGGVGFFNKQNALGNVLPGMFAESHWDASLGVTDVRSTENQVRVAIECLAKLSPSQRVFMFINISALHQPNCIFLPGETVDSTITQAAALAYVDRHLPPLFQAMQQRAPVMGIICADHGTAYGEDDYHGHRLSHPVVWNVPYAEFILPGIDRSEATPL